MQFSTAKKTRRFYSFGPYSLYVEGELYRDGSAVPLPLLGLGQLPVGQQPGQSQLVALGLPFDRSLLVDRLLFQAALDRGRGGLVLASQAAVLDPGANALGFVFSNATAAVCGN